MFVLHSTWCAMFIFTAELQIQEPDGQCNNSSLLVFTNIYIYINQDQFKPYKTLKVHFFTRKLNKLMAAYLSSIFYFNSGRKHSIKTSSTEHNLWTVSSPSM